MNNHSRYKVARIILIFWCLFIGLGAVAGSIGMLTAIDGSNLGMQSMLPYFQVLPFAKILFQDFFFSGIALLIVNGITNLIAASLLFANKKAGIITGGIFGLTLMAWICIQFAIFPPNFMDTIYFIFGVLQALTGYAAFVFWKQEHFVFNKDDFSNVGTNHTRLVVYFSRMGYTRLLAYKEANRTGADIYEVKSTERTEGTLGFWWCGRYGMHRWPMPIVEPQIDIGSYSHVTICTPIWVFTVAAPIRAFCKLMCGRINEVDYIINHFNPSKYTNAAKEMDSLLGLKNTCAVSLSCQMGKFGRQKTF